MQTMLMFYETPSERAKRSNEHAQAYWAGWTAYVAALHEAGIVVGGNGLHLPETATTLRIGGGGERQVQDGPFADTKEQLGGYFVIEVPDIDAALQWAARAPCAAAGGVELRPILPPPGP